VGFVLRALQDQRFGSCGLGVCSLLALAGVDRLPARLDVVWGAGTTRIGQLQPTRPRCRTPEQRAACQRRLLQRQRGRSTRMPAPASDTPGADLGNGDHVGDDRGRAPRSIRPDAKGSSHRVGHVRLSFNYRADAGPTSTCFIPLHPSGHFYKATVAPPILTFTSPPTTTYPPLPQTVS